MKMEEINSKYEELEELIGKILDSISMSKEKQEKIDIKTDELYNETRPMMIEKIKGDIKVAEKEKDEFDGMTKNALINAKKQVLELREKSEKEYQISLLDIAQQQQTVNTKLESMKKRLSEEQVDKAEELAKKSIEKINNELNESKEKYFYLKGNLDNINDKINQYAIVLGIEKEVDSVSLDLEKENKKEPEVEAKNKEKENEIEPKAEAKKEEQENKIEPEVEAKKEEQENEIEPEAEAKKEEQENKIEPEAEVKKEEQEKEKEPEAEVKKEEQEKEIEPEAEVKGEEEKKSELQSEPKCEEKDLENEEEITITNLDGKDEQKDKVPNTEEEKYNKLIENLKNFKNLDDFNKKKLILETNLLANSSLTSEELYNILPDDISRRIKERLEQGGQITSFILDQERTSIMIDGEKIFEIPTRKIDLNKLISSTRHDFEEKLITYKSIGYLQSESDLSDEKVKKLYETFIENVQIEKQKESTEKLTPQQKFEKLVEEGNADFGKVNKGRISSDREYLINVSFNAKKMSYTLNINNPAIGYNKTLVCNLKDLEKSKDYNNFKENYQGNINENEDTYVSYMLKLASEILSEKNSSIRAMTDYRCALEGKYKNFKNITINYDVNGIYGRGYSSKLSDKIMKHAQYHSKKHLASISEKSEFTKFLEKHPNMRNLYTSIVNIGSVNLLKKNNKVKALPEGKNNSKENENNSEIRSTMTFKEKYQVRKRKLANKVLSVGYSVKDEYNKVIKKAKDKKKKISKKIAKRKEEYTFEHIDEEGHIMY